MSSHPSRNARMSTGLVFLIAGIVVAIFGSLVLGIIMAAAGVTILALVATGYTSLLALFRGQRTYGPPESQRRQTR